MCHFERNSPVIIDDPNQIIMMEKSTNINNSGSGSSHPPKAKPNNKHSKKKKAADPRTLFVKFHPPSALITRQHLSDHFSNYGPVNRCSVIRNQSNKSKAADGEGNNDDTANPNSYDRGSKGYGFVRFVHEEDAKSAAEAILQKQRKHQSGRGRNKNKNSVGGGEVMVVDGVRYTIHAERAVDATATATPNNASTSPKKKETSNNASKDSISATVTASNADASSPIKSTDSGNADDATYKAEAKRKRTSRVILRNLSFYANEKHIQSVMEENFGPVAAVDLPKVPDLPNNNTNNDDNNNNNNNNHKRKNNKNNAGVPSHRGFAFVTFTNPNAAKRAVEGGLEIKIKNRLVAIDFSVSKMEHRRMLKEDKGGRDEEEEEGTESESESDGESENENEKKDGDGEDGSEDSSSEDDSDDSEDESESEDEDSDDNNDEEESDTKKASSDTKDSTKAKETPEFNESGSKRTLFLRNVPFDATRHDVFDLFRKFGRIEAVYLVKDRATGVFKGTAFVRFEDEEGCAKAMEASGISTEGNNEGEQFVSSKNIAMGLDGGSGNATSGLTLKGRHILVDLAVDRTTASSLAIQRDADGKPIKKMIGKDKRNLYLKNEGRVSSTTDTSDAKAASAKYGGSWEDLPVGDKAKRERAFAERSTKLRSPLFFINPTRISIRNLAKHITESELKRLVFDALKVGLAEGLVTPKDAVAHWRAGGELAHGEVMRRATDPNLVTPPLDEKNMKGAVPSVYIDRDVSGGKKTVDAPSRGFGFVEFTHHAHALAVLRQLNNNPAYSAEFVAGGKHASEMARQKRGKKGKNKGNKGKGVDPETGAEFLGEDGKVYVPRLIVEFTVENKVKARQQAEKIAQKKANKIKQQIENKEKKQQEDASSSDKEKKKEKKKGRGALQREKKRARKEAGEDDNGGDNAKSAETASKKQKTEEDSKTKAAEKKPKLVKPKKKRKVMDKDEEDLEDMIRSYKSSFAKGVAVGDGGKDQAIVGKEGNSDGKSTSTTTSREKVVKKRWFE